MRTLIGCLFVMIQFAACTARNTAVCCTDPADCATVGLPEGSRCEPGFSCLDHACVDSSCSLDTDCAAPTQYCVDGLCLGCDDAHPCGIEAPVCEATTTCAGCSTSADCAGFPATSVCDANGGCRGCVIDSECESEICNEDGTCRDATTVLYMDTAGEDVGDCNKAAPCLTLAYTLTKASGVQHIVIHPGEYRSATVIEVNALTTPATGLEIHGSGATLSGGHVAIGKSVLTSTGDVPLGIRGITFTRYQTNPPFLDSPSCIFARNARLSNVRFDDCSAAFLGDTELVDFTASNVDLRFSGASARAERGSLQSGNIDDTSLQAGLPVVTIKNVSVFTTVESALTVGNAQYTVRFSPFHSLTGGPAIAGCAASGGLNMRSSIVWAPGRAALAPGCTGINESIVGPLEFALLDNSDPMFVDDRLHVGPTSAAIDRVDCGTDDTLDFERTARPSGVRCDYGSDER